MWAWQTIRHVVRIQTIKKSRSLAKKYKKRLGLSYHSKLFSDGDDEVLNPAPYALILRKLYSKREKCFFLKHLQTKWIGFVIRDTYTLCVIEFQGFSWNRKKRFKDFNLRKTLLRDKIICESFPVCRELEAASLIIWEILNAAMEIEVS